MKIDFYVHVCLCVTLCWIGCIPLMNLSFAEQGDGSIGCPARRISNVRPNGTKICRKKCINTSQCRRNKKCLCDGACGMSCISLEMKCPSLSDIQHGRVVINPYNKFNATATYTCNQGLLLTGGDSSRLCRGNGEWTGSQPQCVQNVCRDPPSVNHAVYEIIGSQNIRSSQGYPRGTFASYRCKRGYIREGYTKIMCLEKGQWRRPRLSCSPKPCGSPGNIANGVRIGRMFVFPKRVDFKCNNGYDLIGSIYRLCQANGKWSRSLPRCRPIKCPTLYASDNGRMFGSDFDYKAEVTFTCNEGYRRKGPVTRTCQSNKNWSGTPVSCELITCGEPNLWQGKVTGTRNVFGSSILFKCNRHTTRNGGRSSYCNKDGVWEPNIPFCLAWCHIPMIDHSKTVFGSDEKGGRMTDHNSYLSVTCKSGFQLIPDTRVKCSNGTWRIIPKCEPSPCTNVRPDSIPNSQLHITSSNHNDKAVYTCNFGYQMNGKNSVICKNGNWFGNLPYCEAKTCPSIHKPQNTEAQVIDNNGVSHRFIDFCGVYVHTFKVEYRCATGYNPKYTFKQECTNGAWSPPTITRCNPDPCQYIGNKKTRLIGRQLSSYPHGSSVNVVCNGNYVLNNNQSTATCSAGEWTPQEPTCGYRKCHLPKIRNGFPTGSILGGRAIGHGETIYVNCNEGYTIEGSIQNDITCTNGHLDTIPRCIAKACIVPDLQHGTYRNKSSGDIVQHTGIIQYSCEIKYKQVSQTPQCIFGVWNKKLSCEKKITYCMVKEIQNGYSNPGSKRTTVGKKIQYHCNYNYVLRGESELQCQYNTSWNKPFPVCEKCTVSMTRMSDYGLIGYNYKGKYLSSEDDCKHSCMDKIWCLSSEYKDLIRICYLSKHNRQTSKAGAPDRGWVYFEKICAIDCLEPNKMQNAKHSPKKSRYKHFEVVDYICNPGYFLEGLAARISCFENGTWSSNTNMKCTKICPNGRLEYAQFTVRVKQVGRIELLGAATVLACQHLCGNMTKFQCKSVIFELKNCYLSAASLVYSDRERQYAHAYNKVCNETCPILADIPVIIQNYRVGSSGVIRCGTKYITIECLPGARWNLDFNAIEEKCPGVNPTRQISTSTGYSRTISTSPTTTISSPTSNSYTCHRPSRSRNVFFSYKGYNIDYTNEWYKDSFTDGAIIHARCKNVLKQTLVGNNELKCEYESWKGQSPWCKESSAVTIHLHYGNPALEKLSWETWEKYVLPSGEIQINYNHKFILDCTGQYRSVVWKKDESIVHPQTVDDYGHKIVRIHSATDSDSGTYLCQASDGASKSVTIQVKGTRRKCGNPGTPANGKRHGHDFGIGSSVSYECTIGYKLVGIQISHCNSLAKWTSPVPLCKVVFCTLGNLPHKVEIISQIQGVQVSLGCESGYMLTDPSKANLQCTANDTWNSTSLPTCTETRCYNAPSAPRFGKRKQSGSNTFGSIIKYSCDRGYYFVGNPIMTCASNGSWVGSSPRCLQNTG